MAITMIQRPESRCRPSYACFFLIYCHFTTRDQLSFTANLHHTIASTQVRQRTNAMHYITASLYCQYFVRGRASDCEFGDGSQSLATTRDLGASEAKWLNDLTVLYLRRPKY